MGYLAVPTAPSRGLTEQARSHAAMQPEERRVVRGRGCTDVDGSWKYLHVWLKNARDNSLQSAILWFEAAFLQDSLLAHSTTINDVSTMCTLVNEQLCSLLLWSLQSMSLCFSLPLSVLISNTDAEKYRGLLKKWLSTLGWLDRLVAGKIPYYTEYKTWDKTSDLENPPFHGGVGWK